MIFILRHIQLIVLLTDKDEKSWEKFHARHGFFGDSFAGLGGAVKTSIFGQIRAKIAGRRTVQIGFCAVMCVDPFDARGESRVIRNVARQRFLQAPASRHSGIGEILI
jgi:hypothetical protein